MGEAAAYVDDGEDGSGDELEDALSSESGDSASDTSKDVHSEGEDGTPFGIYKEGKVALDAEAADGPDRDPAASKGSTSSSSSSSTSDRDSSKSSEKDMEADEPDAVAPILGTDSEDGPSR